MKQKIYWLRGGIIASVIGVTFTLVSLKIEVLNYFALPAYLGIVLADMSFGCDFLDMGWRPSTHPGYCKTAENVLGIIAIIICYFIVGIIVGWIYGKIKNRNNVKNPEMQ